MAYFSPCRAVSLSGTIVYADGHAENITASETLTASCCTGVRNGLLAGAVLSPACKVTLVGAAFLPGGQKRGNRAFPGAFVRLYAEESGVRAPFCAFYVRTASRDKSTVTLEGFGLSDDADEMAELSFPISLDALIEALFPDADTDGLSAKTRQITWLGDMRSKRQTLSCALERSGAFAYVDRSGTLTVCDVMDRENARDMAIPYGMVYALEEPEPAFGPLNTVVFRSSSGEETVLTSQGEAASPLTSLRVSGNPCVLDAVSKANMLSSLQGLTLPSARCAIAGHPGICPGQTAVIEKDGVTIRFPITFLYETYENRVYRAELSCTPQMDASGLSGGAATVSSSLVIGRIDGSQVCPGTLAASALQAGSITGNYLSAACVTADKLAASSVSSGHIAAGSITADKLAAQSVSADKIASGAVTTGALYAGSVTAEKIASGAVSASHLSSGTITADKLHAGLITAQSGLLADACVTSAAIQDLSVTDGKIVSLSAGKLTAGTIDASVITVKNLCADNLTTGTLNGRVIPALGTDKLQDGAVTGAKLGDQAVTAAKIVSGAVTTDKLASGAITTDKLLSGSVTTDKLSVGAVTADKISAHAITADKLESSVGAALDLSSNTTVRARVLENSSVEIGESGLTLTGGQVYISTDSFEVTLASGGQTMLHLTENGMETGCVMADKILSPSVVRVSDGGEITVFGSIGTALQNLPEYLKNDVTVTVPAGQYIENIEIEGLIGRASLTLALSTDALIFGSITVKNCSCPVNITGGTLLCAGQTGITAQNARSLEIADMCLFGAERTDEQDGTQQALCADASFVKISDSEFSRFNDCIAAKNGAKVLCDTLSGGAEGGYTCVCTAGNYAYLRSKASDSYTSLAHVPGGTVLDMVSNQPVNGSYYQVVYNGKTGFLSSSVVSNITRKQGGAASLANLGCAYKAQTMATIYGINTKPMANGSDTSDVSGSVVGSPLSAFGTSSAPLVPGNIYRYQTAACLVKAGSMALSGALIPAQGMGGDGKTAYQSIWILESAASIQGMAIESAELTLSRVGIGGGSDEKTVYLFGHAETNPDCTALPALIDLQTEITLMPNQELTVLLPDEVCDMLSDGTITGFAVGASGDYVTLGRNMTLRIR